MEEAHSRLLSSVFIIAFVIQAGNAQMLALDSSPKTDKDYYWISFAGGWSWDVENVENRQGNYGEEYGWMAPAVGIGLYYQTSISLFSMRAIAAQRLWGPETVGELSLLYGVCTKEEFGFAAISAGFGVFGDSRAHPTLGIPLEAQLVWTPSSAVGIGISGIANLNTHSSRVGALLSLHIGMLK